MLKKWLFFPVLMALLLAAGSVFAQDGGTTPVFCGSLSEADCQFLTESQQASMALESATFDLNGGLTISNLSALPGAPFDSLAFTLTGDGSYAIDPALKDTLSNVQQDMMDLMKDPTQLGAFYEKLLSGVTGELNFSLGLPVELKAFGTASNPVPEKLSLDLRLIDGIGYINLSTLSEQLPQANIPSGWYGMELAKFSGMMFENLMSQMDTQDMPQMDFSMFSQLTDPQFLGEFVKMERQADESGEAVFVTTIDYTGLFGSSFFRDMMQSQMSTYGNDMSEAELNQVLDMVQQMYSGLELSVTTRIGLEDHYTHAVSMSMHWDMSALMNMMNSMSGDAGSAAPTPTEAPMLDFNLGLSYDHFNAAPALEVPDAVEIFKAEDLMKMFPTPATRSA